jgi:putative flippase GtrA
MVLICREQDRLNRLRPGGCLLVGSIQVHWLRIRGFSKFATVGCTATLVHFSVLSLLVEVFHFKWPTLASAIGSIFGIATAYLGNYHWTFRRTEPHREFVSRFVATYLFTMAVHTGLVFGQIDGLGLSYVVAFVFATTVSTVLNFGLSKLVVFERRGCSSTTPLSTLARTNVVP